MKYLKFETLWRGFEGASPFAKLILIVLFILSVISWAIALNKFIRFIVLKRKTKKFLKDFSLVSFKDFLNKPSSLQESKIPLTDMLKVCKEEYAIEVQNSGETMIIDSGKRENILLNVLDGVGKVYRKEIDRLEKYLTTLATITGVSPFLGLLGTVWGIMEAFLEIRKSGSAHISVLAPGIADALITTIAGLLVAIPALVFYNYFTGEVKKYENICQEFIDEVKIKIRKALFQ